MSRLQELRDQIKNLREQAMAEAAALMQEGAVEIFEGFPELQSISWRQYTPYFNDGDACTFRAMNDYPQMVLVIDGEEHDLEEVDEFTLKNFNKYLEPQFHPFKAKLEEAYKWISQFDEDELLEIYGDHVVVTLNRDGSTLVDSCDHD